MAMAEPADLNVDELRRRARRRLVGAVVLALGVAVVVPMLLETEQKPLGEDVAVKIPPIDDGKFVNRLAENRAKDAAKSPSKPAAKDEARDSTPADSAATERAPKYDTRLPETPLSVPAPAAATPQKSPTDTSPTAPIAAAPSTSAGDKAPAMAQKPADAKSATPERAPAQAPKPPAASASPASVEPKAVAPHDGFAVQLAAFADDKGANALAGRLKRAGYTAYTEPLKTSKGTLWRVRVGPYPSRDAALAARDKLKTEGQSGIVAAIK